MSKRSTYITDGISQRDRYPASLDPGYFQVEERTADDLLLFVTELAYKYKYYNSNNKVDGNWLDFFLSDPNLMLRLLTSFDFKRYELEYSRNRYALLNLATKEAFSTKLKETFEQLFEFIFFQYEIFERFKQNILSANSTRLLNYQRLIESDSDYKSARYALYAASAYFENDPAFKFQYKNKSVIVHLVAVAEQESKETIIPLKFSTLPDLIKEVVEIFDALFSKFDILYSQLKIAVAYFQKEKQQEKIQHTPHISLLLSFFELYQVLKNEMNLVTQKHLDFYYKNLLEIEARKAEPDKVSVVMSLNKGVNEYLLEAGETLLATIPGKADKEAFRLKEDTLVTQAKIAALCSIYKSEQRHSSSNDKQGDPESDNVIYAAINPVAEVADYAKKNYQNKTWPLFGKDQQYLAKDEQSMQLADMGLVLAAPVLLAQDGKRTFHIKLHLKDISGLSTAQQLLFKNSTTFVKNLGSAFIVDITGTSAWIRIEEYQVISNINTDTKLIEIKFILGAVDPAVGIYKPDIHGYSMQFRKPAIRIMQNFNKLHNPFAFFQQYAIERIEIKVHVEGSNLLQLQNNNGKVSPSAPFQLFGPLPAVGNYLDISNANIFNRFTRWFKIILKWDGLPANADGFTSYYEGYNNNITNESFKVKLSSRSTESNSKSPNEKELCNLFQMNDDRLSQYLSGQSTLLYNGFPKLRFDNDMQFGDQEDNRADAGIGTVRVELAAPADAFGHQLYPVVFPKVLMHNSRWYVFKQKPAPNPPYAPIVNAVLVNYELEHSEIISGTKGADAKGQVELFHIYPFGHTQIYPQQMQQPAKLMPYVDSRCNLYIGLADVIPGKVLNFLFQLEEDNYDELEKNIQPFMWHYLHRNKWEMIEKENILEDNTYGFKGTGTVKIILPENITNGNTLFDPQYCWIRISGDNENGSKVKGIFTQVVTAVRDIENRTNYDSLSLVPDCIKEFLGKVPEIKDLHQPFSSYHGQLPETDRQYYSRISENLRHKNRIVTATDISQKILEQFPQVHKVLCFNNTEKNKGTATDANVMVVVIPKVDITVEGNTDRYVGPKISIYGLYKIQNYLAEIVSPGIKVNVYNPEYEKIKVVCCVKFIKGKRYENSGMLVQQLNHDLRIFITPWLYKRDLEINTGSGIYPGEILNFIKDRPYVDLVQGFNVIHFYSHTDADSGKALNRLMASNYLNSSVYKEKETKEMEKKKREDRAVYESFKPNPAPPDMKLILKGSKPGAILISSKQHLITVLDNSMNETEPGNNDKPVNPGSGIGRLVIGEEFRVMNPYLVSVYPGISREDEPVDEENFDFIF